MAEGGFVRPVLRVTGCVQAVHAYLRGNAEDVVDTSDATASAEDLIKGKSAYVRGEKIIGTITEVLKLASDADSISEVDENLEFQFSLHDKRVLGRNVPVIIRVPKEQFGTAKAEDVAVGKTFTSGNGLLVEGTGSLGESGSSFAVYGVGDTVVFTTVFDAVEEEGWLVITGSGGGM